MTPGNDGGYFHDGKQKQYVERIEQIKVGSNDILCVCVLIKLVVL
jgi:hypothetical protein